MENTPPHLSRRDAIRALGIVIGATSLGACAGKTQTPALGGIGDPIPGVDTPPSSTANNNSGSAAQEALADWRNRNHSAETLGGILPKGVVARDSWTNAKPIIALADPMQRVTRITIHHEGSTPFSSTSSRDVRQRLDQIRKFHLSRGWADIGYHYVIDPAGRVHQARPIALQGAHVKYNNEQNLGIMVLGNFEEQSPTAKALASLQQFVGSQMSQYKVPLRSVYTHQEIRPTLCPGRNLQGRLVAMRRAGGVLARA